LTEQKNPEQKKTTSSHDEKEVHDHSRTEREVEREEEDRDFVPVIVKRTDEALRHPDDILENAIVEGLEQLERRSLSLFLGYGCRSHSRFHRHVSGRR
jgi:hypothetical protein